MSIAKAVSVFGTSVFGTSVFGTIGCLCLALPWAMPLPTFAQERAPTEATTYEDKNGELTLVDITHNLQRAGWLDDDAYHEVLRSIDLRFISQKSDLLQRVSREFLNDISSEWDVSDSAAVVQVIFVGEATPEEIASQQRLLDRLEGTGVLTATVYRTLHTRLTAGECSAGYLVLKAAFEQAKREEALDPDILRPRLEAFVAAGIMSGNEYSALMRALNASELQSPLEMFNYIGQAQVFDLSDYSVEPESYFPQVHQSVADMLLQTELLSGSFDGFSLELIPKQWLNSIFDALFEGLEQPIEGFDSSFSIPDFYYAVVSTRLNDHAYQQSSDYIPPTDEPYSGLLIGEEFIHLFNKMLRDRSSRYRLYAIASTEPYRAPNQFGVIALTETQAAVYFRYGSVAAHEETFTSDRVTEVITLIKDIGLLSHLSEADIATGEALIARSYITRPHEILLAFPNVVVPIEWESAGADDTYTRLLQAFAAISRGNFAPADIDSVFNWQGQSASAAFTLNDNRYSADLDVHRNWLDFAFFELIETAAAAEVSSGQLYPLAYDAYETEGYIFLTESQLEILRSQDLITVATRDAP